MTSKVVMLDDHVEGSLPKGLAKEMGLVILTRLMVPRPNLVSVSHSGNIHKLSSKTSAFSTLTDLFIHSQSAGDSELDK